MFRTFTIVFVVFLVSGLIGCRFCASPYDYCPPTFTGDECGFPGNPYDPLYTAGSRFYGTEDVCLCTGCDLGCRSCDENYQYDSSPSYSEPPIDHSTDPSVEPSLAPSLEDSSEPRSYGEETSVPVPTLEKRNSESVPTVGIPDTVTSTRHPPRQPVRAQSAVKSVPLPPAPAAPNPYYASNARAPHDGNVGDLPFTKEELQKLNPDAVEIEIIGIEDSE